MHEEHETYPPMWKLLESELFLATFSSTQYLYTAKCCYNAFQYIVILHAALQWHQQNIKSDFEFTKDTT